MYLNSIFSTSDDSHALKRAVSSSVVADLARFAYSFILEQPANLPDDVIGWSSVLSTVAFLTGSVVVSATAADAATDDVVGWMFGHVVSVCNTDKQIKIIIMKNLTMP